MLKFTKADFERIKNAIATEQGEMYGPDPNNEYKALEDLYNVFLDLTCSTEEQYFLVSKSEYNQLAKKAKK